jgi:hypothetical protein
MTRGVHSPDAQGSQLELPAVLEGLVLVTGIGGGVDMDDRPGRRGEAAVSGDVVGVIVGLEDVLDAHALVAGERQVLVDVELGVDDRGDPGVLISDEVRGARQVVVGYLTEDQVES